MRDEYWLKGKFIIDVSASDPPRYCAQHSGEREYFDTLDELIARVGEDRQPAATRPSDISAGQVLGGLAALGVMVLGFVLWSRAGSDTDRAGTDELVDAEPQLETASVTPFPESADGAFDDSVSGSFGRTAACDEWQRITLDVSLNDEESAAKFHVLAARTQDAELSAEFERLGDAFDRHDESIPIGRINDLCFGG